MRKITLHVVALIGLLGAGVASLAKVELQVLVPPATFQADRSQAGVPAPVPWPNPPVV